MLWTGKLIDLSKLVCVDLCVHVARGVVQRGAYLCNDNDTTSRTIT